MKNLKNLLVFTSLLILGVACRKDSNSLSGFVTFHHPTTQDEFGATLASVSLYKETKEDTGDIATYSTKVDEFGRYYFPRIIKGKYEMEIRYNFESYYYDTILPMSFKYNEKQELDILLLP